MRDINRIVIHTSATPPSMDIGAFEIREWHTSPSPRDPSKPWSDIGYHWVDRRNGVIEQGRPVERPGAHVRGANQHSIGICWVGGVDEDGKPQENITEPQYVSLVQLTAELAAEYKVPVSRIQGHKEVIEEVGGSPKACPCLDMDKFRQDVRAHMAEPEEELPAPDGTDMVESLDDKVDRAQVQALVDIAKTVGPVLGGALASLATLPAWLGVSLIAGAVISFGIYKAFQDE